MNELLTSLRAYVAVHPGGTMFNEVESTRRRVLVRERFNLPENHSWWWQCLKEARSFSYTDGDAGLNLLKNTVPDKAQVVWLFVTDDELPPWYCISGTIDYLVEMLREHRFFEYFVADPDVSWVVFDTHHNELVTVGCNLTSDDASRNVG